MSIQASAHQKYIRQTPRKLRLIADTIRGQKVDQALVQLKFTPKKAAVLLEKVLRQAQANAVNNKAAENTLVVSDIQVQEGPMLKRWQPVSRGRAHSIHKRMSHIKITVAGKQQ